MGSGITVCSLLCLEPQGFDKTMSAVLEHNYPEQLIQQLADHCQLAIQVRRAQAQLSCGNGCRVEVAAVGEGEGEGEGECLTPAACADGQ
jgi:hypothetical protein